VYILRPTAEAEAAAAVSAAGAVAVDAELLLLLLLLQKSRTLRRSIPKAGDRRVSAQFSSC
jgi:hypothetical protein